MAISRVFFVFLSMVFYLHFKTVEAQVINKPLKAISLKQDTSKQKIKHGTPVNIEEKKTMPSTKTGQVPFNIGNEKIPFLDIPQTPVFVTDEFRLVLKDNTTKISRSIDGKNTFDIIKSKSGGYVIAYAAASENQSIYAKGVMFNLGDDLKQIGLSKIFTLSDEDILGFVIKESLNNQIGLAYLCKVAATYDEYKQPVNPKTILKQTVFTSGNSVRNMKLDEHPSGLIELLGLYQGISNSRIYYNKEDKGKISLIYGSNSYFNCDIQPIKKQESFGDNTTIQAKIKSIHDFEYNVLMETSTKYYSVIWNLEEYGFSSGRSVKPSWPLLLVEPIIISTTEQVCRIENDPYTTFKEDFELSEIVKMELLSNGNLILLQSEEEGISRIQLYNSHLEKVNEGKGIAPLPNFLNSRVILDKDRLLTLELDNNKWLVFASGYKDQTIQYRAVVYDFQNDKILWSLADVLWEEPSLNHRDIKLLKLDEKRVLISYIDDSDYPNNYQQTIKFRILNLNF